MAVLIRNATTVTLGAFLASSGTAIDALNNVGGAYVYPGANSTQLFITTNPANFPGGTVINSVTVRVIARLASEGSRNLNPALRLSGNTFYHPSGGTNVTDLTDQTYSWTWDVSPFTEGAAWTAEEVNGIDRTYLRANLASGTSDIYVDYMELEVDYGGSGQEMVRTYTDTVGISDSMSRTIAQGIFRTYTDTVGISDQTNRVLNANKTYTDNIRVSDTDQPMEMGIEETLQDTVTLTDWIEVVFVPGPGYVFPGISDFKFGEVAIVRIYHGPERIW